MKMRKTLLKWFVISLFAVMMFVFGGIDGRHLYSTYVGEVNTAVSSDQKAGTGDCLAVHVDCGLNGDVNILIWQTWRHGQVLLAGARGRCMLEARTAGTGISIAIIIR